MKIALVGDSDMERWPVSEYPCTQDDEIVIVSGQSGATLSQIRIPNLSTIQIVIVCAGENDIGSNLPLWQSEQALRNLLQQMIHSYSHPPSFPTIYVLGPKMEPWLQDDRIMRQKYWQMHLSFQRIIATEFSSQNVHYVDCLLLFCSHQTTTTTTTTTITTTNHQGAIYKAKPNPIYFHKDQLHLSKEGYRIWKELLLELMM